MGERENAKYFALLFSLVAIFIFAPFFEQPDGSNLTANLVLIGVLLLSIWIISHDKKQFIAGILIAVPLLLSNLLSIKFADHFGFMLALLVCAVTFFVYITTLLFKQVLAASAVNAGIIVGSICVYLLLGLCWAFVYGIIELINPGSFSQSVQTQHIGSFIYFSLVTLSTLGFGDITPLSSVARAFVAMQAITGQLYLTVLVAKLVGNYIADSEKAD